MPSTLRQQIFDALVTQLKTINTPTYNTAVGTKVDEWRSDYDAIVRDEMPRLNVRDESEPQQPLTFNTVPMVQRTMRVAIEGFVSGSGTAATADAARALLGDIETAIAADRELGGLCTEINFVGEAPIAVTQANRTLGACELQIEIKYETRGFDPYTAEA